MTAKAAEAGRARGVAPAVRGVSRRVADAVCRAADAAAATGDVGAALPDGGAVPEEGVAEDPAQLRRDAAVAAAATEALAAGDTDLVEELAAAYDTLVTATLTDVDGRARLEPGPIAERRRRGAFATPPRLAATLARHALPGPAAGSVAGRAAAVVDPACGSGALLVAALDRLVALGGRPDVAVAALHGVDADPAAVAVCRARVLARAAALGAGVAPAVVEARIVTGDALLGPSPRSPGAGLVWHETFPAVLDRDGAPSEPVTGWRGGFDAVLANPPWERLKVTLRDWAGLPPPRLRADRAAGARSLRDAGRHPLTGAGELNAYLPFVETCWRLLAPAGRAAVVVPEGIAADRSAAALLRAVLDAGALEVLHLLDPPQTLFQGVSRRVRVAVVVLGAGPHVARPGRVARVAVGVADPDAPPPGRTWTLDGPTVRRVNPNTGTAPLYGTARDAALVGAVHDRLPVLLRRPEGPAAPDDDPWQVRLITPLHMTRDARWFHDAPADGLLPLWEAKHAGLLDHRGGGTAGHRYWVPEELVHERFADLVGRGWLAGYRNVTTSDSPRTLLPTPLPVAGVGNSLPLLSAPRLPLLLAALASLPADYVVRQKHAGPNLNFFKLEQVPLPPPSAYDVPAPWQPDVTLATWVLRRLAAACRWDGALTALAAELREQGVTVPDPDGATPEGADPPDGADPQDAAAVPVRALALAELDAAHAVLYGFGRADLEHVLTTFPALRARQEARYGRFLTADLALAAHDRLLAAVPGPVPGPVPGSVGALLDVASSP